VVVGSPLPGYFSSPATAVLVALLEHEERVGNICGWETLLELAASKLEAGQTFKPLEVIRAQTEFCEAWEQVRAWEGGVINFATIFFSFGGSVAGESIDALNRRIEALFEAACTQEQW
jgi:hypothetical protein